MTNSKVKTGIINWKMMIASHFIHKNMETLKFFTDL